MTTAAKPVLLAPGEGEAVSDKVTIKADLPEVTLTESDYPPGESGPGPHIHREHCDCFYVLDGELEFGVADETLRGRPGDFVLIPPEVVHTFRNPGPDRARFLNIHAPSKGFGDHLRTMSDAQDAGGNGFDSFDPPPDGGRPASDALVRPAGEGEVIAVGPSQAVVKAGGEESDLMLSLTETTLAPGFPGPVPHLHEGFADSFWVLDGVLTVRLGDQTVEAGPGSYALVPPHNVHTFSNPGEEPVRLLNLMAPGGFERYLREVAAALAAGAAPGPETMARIAERYDFRPAG